MSVLPNTLKDSKIRSAIEIFLHIKSPDQDQTGTTLRNQSKESKEFSLITKSRKLCKKQEAVRPHELGQKT